MEISDIIKKDTDRIFTVDPECYIIFTGESTDDIQPFIRIGTWTDMPIELIPLIENIIITDGLVGDPSHEQFNIDVRYLPTNRYIGSRTVVKKFFDFQKIFSLDLTNAAVVDIDKDLPELSAEKNISRKDQFIGVFYRDGNFKILLGRNSIFDLNRMLREPINYKKFNDILSREYIKSGRYDGSGLVVAGHNPIFYHNNSFCSYLFPSGYFGEFSRLGIDPGKIRALFYPSQNLMNITGLLKWLDGLKKKIRIYTNRDDIGLVKKLFPSCAIRNEAFSGFTFRDGGLTVRNHSGTYNLSIRYDGAGRDGGPLSVAFIKGPAGVREILMEYHDCLIMTYSAFEDITLLLSSTDTPWAIIDDGNRNIAKLAGDRIVLSPGMHYEFRAFNSFDGLISLPRFDEPVLSESRADPAALAQAALARLESGGEGFRGPADAHNLLSLVRMHLSVARDRKLSSTFAAVARDLAAAVDRKSLVAHSPDITILLALYGKKMFTVVQTRDDAGGPRLFDDVTPAHAATAAALDAGTGDYFNRILADRERLKLLIEIYTRSDKYPAAGKELDRLRDAIDKRRKKYHKESLSLDRNGAADGASAKSAKAARRGAEVAHPDRIGAAEAAPGESAKAARRGAEDAHPGPKVAARRLRRAAMIGMPLLIIAIISIILLLMRSGYIDIASVFTAKKEHAVHSRDIDARYRDLGRKQNIRIRDNDILRYANQVAVNNGYHPIAATKLRVRNPDWIYPENAFVMLDGQKVIVSRGDTLWNLSRNKLIEAGIRFNDIMKDFQSADIKRKSRMIEQARRFAHTRDNLELLKKSMNELQRMVPGKAPR